MAEIGKAVHGDSGSQVSSPDDPKPDEVEVPFVLLDAEPPPPADRYMCTDGRMHTGRLMRGEEFISKRNLSGRLYISNETGRHEVVTSLRGSVEMALRVRAARLRQSIARLPMPEFVRAQVLGLAPVAARLELGPGPEQASKKGGDK